jgi:hypothetical protein
VKRLARDPFVASTTVLVLLAAVGFVAIGVGWRGVASSLFVPVQLPYFVSGVMGGLALVGLSFGLISIQVARRREAAERADFSRLVGAAAALLNAARMSR